MNAVSDHPEQRLPKRGENSVMVETKQKFGGRIFQFYRKLSDIDFLLIIIDLTILCKIVSALR